MKIYIDFDGTLFNTDKYIEDVMNILNEYGISTFVFDDAKETLFNSNNLFNMNIMIDYLVNKYNINTTIKSKIDNLLNNSYVYLDVIECLNMLIDSGYELNLLTYGDKIFQRLKINSSNLSSFFKEIIISEKDKSKLDIDYKNSIFIDNNPFEIEKFYDSNATKVIRIRRNNDKYSEMKCEILNVAECDDFYQVIEILKGGFRNE